MHVKGLTMTHPGIPDDVRGSYAAIGHPVIIEHLTSLGVTAVELLPVHQFVNDSHLVDRGLSNYWGYNTIGFLAPHNGYASSLDLGQQTTEFKAMVKSLHEADIEVILDVVYNHTAEGNELGPTIAFRGIDNAAYYRLVDSAKQHYYDTTGTGNSLLMRNPHVLQLIMDSLRYWVLEMHVDGFRFDLAATLARQFHEVDKLSAFFDIIQQDPVISQVKLIAEPWDLGDGGYQVGNFPPYGRSGTASTATPCVTSGAGSRRRWLSSPPGSPDPAISTSTRTGVPPRRSTSWLPTTASHCAIWCPTTRSTMRRTAKTARRRKPQPIMELAEWRARPTIPRVNALRLRQQRNFITTLMVSQGVPMLAHGDELGRTQQGNNNVYAQDNEISWVHWELDADQKDLLAFTSATIDLRKAHPVLRRRRFFAGDAKHGGQSELGDILVVQARCVRDGRGRLEFRIRPQPDGLPQR